MGAARGFCVRAWVLVGTASVCSSLSLPGCQFPEYGMAASDGGRAGTPPEGGASAEGGAREEGGQGASAGDTGAAGASGAAGAQVQPEPCPSAEACVAAPPKGWRGPYAFWDGKARPL